VGGGWLQPFLVVQGVWEGGRLVVVDGHAGVVGEVGLVEHGEHVVPAW
jgi:hypothetical protein